MNLVCPYCRTEINDVDGGRMECSVCHTPHHEDCYAENGGCTVFGCPQSPADEPKISLTGSDFAAPQTPTLAGPGTSPAVTTIAMSPPPPSPNAADTTSVAPPPPLAGYGRTPPPPPPGQPPSTAPRLTAAEIYAGVDAHKNRAVYVLLGLFLGAFGAHNFYAGYYRRGAAQAALSLFSWWLFSQGYGTLIAWFWAVVEICLINKDADGVQFS